MDSFLKNVFTAIITFSFVAVEVSSQTTGDIRLAGTNSNSSQGRVEVYYNGVWGTVCDDGFDTTEAIVVCKQLNFVNPSNAVAVKDGRFGAGTGDILIDDLNCAATETRLSDCPFGGWNKSDCTHAEDVGVVCPSSTVTAPPTLVPPTSKAPVIPDTGNCTAPDPDIRIIGPSNLNGVGVVQMRRNGVWGGVCDNRWDILDARVVCRMLCFDPEKALSGGVAFATSGITEPMTVDNVACTGNEAKITDCPQSPWAVGSCQRSEMAKVTCVDLDNAPPRRPEPLLDCTNGLLSASFSKTRDPFLEEKHLSVALTYTGPCNAVKSTDPDYVMIQVPFDECGTQRTSNATHIIYGSVIKYLPTSSTGDVSSSNTYMVHVTCELPRDVLADKPLVPLTETVTQVAPGEFIVNMNFYRNNSFKIPVTQFPLEIPLGEWLNTALELNDVDKNLVLVVPNCYATPTADKNHPVKYPLFTEKCITDDTVGFFPLNDTVFGYRYMVFRFVQYAEVYIHCDAYICEHNDTSPECDRSCFETTTTPSPGAGRRKRSLRFPQHVYVSSKTLIVYDTDNTNEIIRPIQNTTTRRPSTQSIAKQTTTSSAEITRQSSKMSQPTSQSQTFSKHVTATTSHVTNHPAENGHTESLVEEIFILDNGSSSICQSCFLLIFISVVCLFL